MGHQVPFDIKHRTEEAFVAFLRSAETLAGIDIVAASNRDAKVGPLHCFVVCVEAVPQMAYGPLFKARVQVVVVSNIDDNDHIERRKWSEAVISHLTSVDEYDYKVQTEDTDPSLCLRGWIVGALQEISAGQQAGDVYPLLCGVQSAIGAAEEGTATTV